MPTDNRVIALFKEANPVPDPERLPEPQLNADALLASGAPEPMIGADPQFRASRGWRAVVAVAAMAGAAAVVAVTLLFVGGGDPVPDDESVTAETTAAPTPTTSPPASTSTTQSVDASVDLSALRAMVDAYHEAYNSGEAEAAFALLSPLSPEVSPINLEFWIDSLGEQVFAECVPSLQIENGLMCVERYRDRLHGPAGETIRTTFHYFESDGRLGRLHDRYEFRAGDCVDSRCPGDALDTSGGWDFAWSYEAFETDLFSWLEQSYPEVAQSIGEPANLSYFLRNSEAVVAALPYVDEFVAQSETWPRVTGQRDLAGMSVLDAVLAEHEAYNSHDPGIFQAWYGRPPDDWVRWMWGFDTRFVSECETTEIPAVVECTSSQIDGFYTKAGAIFEQTQLWTVSGNELILLHTTGLSSGGWVWYEFDRDMKAWMQQAYPEVAAEIFVGQDLIRSGRTAAIAMDYIDEFLEQSSDYPRAADPIEAMVEMITVVLFTE